MKAGSSFTTIATRSPGAHVKRAQGVLRPPHIAKRLVVGMTFAAPGDRDPVALTGLDIPIEQPGRGVAGLPLHGHPRCLHA